MKNPEVKTYGCRLNFYESEVIRKFAKENNLQDRTFINSCAVTNKTIADLKTEIRKLKKNDPDNKIILTGCAAQIHKDEFVAMNEIDSIIGNKEKLESKTYKEIRESNDRINKVGDIFEHGQAISPIIKKVENRIRGFVQIQNGCDHRCTFCIIPFGRGNSRSSPAGVIVDQIKRLVGNGYREIVLTGVDLTSWGADLPSNPKLGNLVLRILKLVPDLERLRLSSIDSIEVDPLLMEAIANERRLMPHLHLSLQSGDNMILKRMKRRHSRDDAIMFCNTARKLRPEITFGADIIAGFPTETDEMFENSVRLIDECRLTWLHVFPFSARTGTPAARMPQTDGRIIKKRAAALRSLGKIQVAKHLKSEIGKRHNILVETPRNGRTEQFTEVLFGTNQIPGDIVRKKILGSIDTKLFV